MYTQLVNLIDQASPNSWKTHDFGTIDQLHTGGLEATRRLLKRLPDNRKNLTFKGLDIGCGLGGCCRIIASEYPWIHMTGTDINEEYIRAAKLINAAIHPPLTCEYKVANSLDLPFAAHQFDFIVSQHTMMSIMDKALLVAQIDQVLKPGGMFLMHEIFLAPEANTQDIDYPMPWADMFEQSYLHTWPSFINLTQQIGLIASHYSNDSQICLEWLHKTRQANHHITPKFEPHLVLGPNAGLKAQNLSNALKQGNLAIYSACWHKPKT